MATVTGKGGREGTDLRVLRHACTLRADGGPELRLLSDWRGLDAYVLLGDPGAGKSESLRAESRDCKGVYLSARDFITLGTEPADAGKTIFIDGLDEMRAGVSDDRAPLDAIRARLKGLGCPRFRLSCREHDWRTQTDLAALCQVAPGGSVQELHLAPLSREEQRQLIQARTAEVPDVEAFLRHADELGLANLFGNPLLLDLTVRAVAVKGGWPESRRMIYDIACRELATERSPEHLDAKPLQPGDVDRLLDDAGLLCAVLLLSGKASLIRVPDAKVSSIAWHNLPAELQLHKPSTALESKIFATAASESTPRHRSIAEHLAGQAIARRLDKGLPMGRVLALMQGGDGGIVEPLRGLLAWLTVHHSRDRPQLIRLDPMATVLNGDISAFSITDKLLLLQALGDEAQRNPWLLNQQWVSYPFAPLATPDMADALCQVLAEHSPEASHQALVDCVLRALNHGEAMPRLGSVLEAWVEDSAAWFRNRADALSAWKRSVGFQVNKAREWLEQLHQGQLQDQDARLSGQLLLDLYPTHVGPDEVLRYWPKPGAVSANTVLPPFWHSWLIKASRPQDFAVLADAWPQVQPAPRHPHHDNEWSRLRSRILASAVEESGDQVDDQRLLTWLNIGLDPHGFSKLDQEAGGGRIAKWLSERPQRIKSLVSLCWHTLRPDAKTGRRCYWTCEQRLHGARMPSDWLRWLLQQAADAPNEELARYCFDHVARAAVDPPPGFDVPTLVQIEYWVEVNANKWPQAHEWLLAQWSSSIEDNWQSDEHRRQRKHEAETLASKEARRAALAPHLNAIMVGTAPAQVMHQLSGAHEERFYDIGGDTPEQRVQDFLASDEATARAAIAGIALVLERKDLPSADEVLDLDKKGKFHLLRPAALLAARLAQEHAPDVVDAWPDALLSTLVACWLTDGTGETPSWYQRAVASRPAVVAPLLVRYTLSHLRRKGPLGITGLWALSREPGHAALARLVLPPLLERFPSRASEPARRELNGSLLAALHLLDDGTASAIVRRKLDQPSMDVAQRICWLVANLRYGADALQLLLDTVGKSERRSVMLGIALHDQGSMGHALQGVPAVMLSRLVELLAPITQPQWPLGEGWVGPEHHRRDTVRALIDLMANDPRQGTAAELQRLVNVPRLKPWHDHLRYSLLSQQGVAREAHYVHPAPEAVALVLANRAPANQADLKALTVDHLGDIGRHLRGADAFGLQFFWRALDDGSKLPRTENECRDLLLQPLRERLEPLGILVVPERRAADDKRADLRIEAIVGGKPLAVPIEIKKEDNKGLWLAWRDQLQALYSNDPAANGHGIYLVLWFGQKPRSSPEGARPFGANDLQQLLTARIGTADRTRLTVLALDLSMPA